MLTVTYVSYSFNVNGNYTKVMQARRGIRQRDPLSPLLFVIIMEYLNMFLHKMQKDSNFNYHAQCEKLSITHIAFVDDVLMFSRGDLISVEMMMKTTKVFSMSTSLIFNPRKCKIYFGGVDGSVKQNIKGVTTFVEGSLPFKYLGVSLTSKQLSIHHYMVLVDKIVGRIKH